MSEEYQTIYENAGSGNGSGSGGSRGSGSGNDTASTTKAYHNGGVEGDSFADWYSANLETEFSASGSEGQTILDLSDAGAAKTINESVAPDGTHSGTVEFSNADGEPVGWGHYDGVDEVIPSDDPTSKYYTEDDLNVIGAHGPGQPPEVSLDQFMTDGSDGSDTGGTKGSGTGGSGSGGTKGSGSGSGEIGRAHV